MSVVGSFITSVTVSDAATLDLENVFDSTYDVYKVFIYNVVPATDNSVLHARVGTGATPTWQATNYLSDSTTNYVIHATGVGNDTGETMCAEITVHSPSATVSCLVSYSMVVLSDAGGSVKHRAHNGGSWTPTTAVTSLRFLFSSGNISGTATVYGLNKS